MGTVALQPADASTFLSSVGCNGPDAMACMRRYLLANQLTVNLSEHPELPNPEQANLSFPCTAIGVRGTLGEWLSTGLTILINPTMFMPDKVLETKDALAGFAES